MANYEVNNAQGGTAQAVSSSYKTLVQVSAATATLTNAKIYDVMFGTLGTPADQSYQFDMSRSTTITTGTTAAPIPLDPSARAAGSVGTVNFTAEPTVTATSSLFNLGVNQRASYRWVAAPGSELVVPAINVNGIVLRVQSISGGTATATGSVFLSE